MRVGLVVLAFSSIVWLGCSADPASGGGGLDETSAIDAQDQGVVYGNESRRDVFKHLDATLRERAQQSTVALMRPHVIDASDPDDVTFDAPNLGQARDLCSTERYRRDPTAADCSGTLIDDDLVLTAGHCVMDASECADTRFVFNYYRPSDGVLQTVTTDDIFSCQSIEVREEGFINGQWLDYAVVRLDRAATPRFTPAPVRAGNTPMAVGSKVAVVSSPSGIPFKIDSGGKVLDSRADVLDYFVATTDTFGGSSGAAVYDMADYTVAGILVVGQPDYVENVAEGCFVVNTCPKEGCSGGVAEEITYVYPAISHFCASHTSARLCSN